MSSDRLESGGQQSPVETMSAVQKKQSEIKDTKPNTSKGIFADVHSLSRER